MGDTMRLENFFQFWHALNAELAERGEPEVPFGDAHDWFRVALDPTLTLDEIARRRNHAEMKHEKIVRDVRGRLY